MKRTRFSIAGLMGFVLIVALGFGGLKAANPLWASAYFTLAFVCLCAGVLLSIQARGKKRAFWVGFSFVGWIYLLTWSQNYDYPPQFLSEILLNKAEELFFPGSNNTQVSIAYMPTPLPAPTIPATLAVLPPPPTLVTPVPTPPSVSLTIPGPPQSSPSGTPPSPPSGEAEATTDSMATVTGNLSGTFTAPALPAPILPPTPPATFSFATTNSLTVPQTPQQSFHHIGQSLATLILAYIGGIFSLYLFRRRERSEAPVTPEVSPSSP